MEADAPEGPELAPAAEPAPAAAPEVEQEADQLRTGDEDACQEAATAKKSRASRAEAAHGRLVAAQAKLARVQAKLDAAIARPGYEKTKEIREAAINKAKEELAAQQAAVEAARTASARLQRAEEVRADEKAAQEAEKLKQAEEKKQTSAAAQVLVVECKLAYDKEFDSGKSKYDNVWESVHKLYMTKLEEEELSVADDGLTVEGLRTKYNLEIHHFRGYCKEVQRYTQSGAPAEDLEKIQTRCAQPCPLPHVNAVLL